MEQDFLMNFITKIQQEQEQKDVEEKRKNQLFFLKQFLQNSLKKNLKFSEQKQKNKTSKSLNMFD